VICEFAMDRRASSERQAGYDIARAQHACRHADTDGSRARQLCRVERCQHATALPSHRHTFEETTLSFARCYSSSPPSECPQTLAHHRDVVANITRYSLEYPNVESL